MVETKKIEMSHEPQIDAFKIKGKLKGTMKDLVSLLRSISFLEVAPEKEVINVAYVESRDINKRPYLFSIMKITDGSFEVVYSIPAEVGPNKRRTDIIRYILNILSLIESQYVVDNKALYQLIENSVKEVSNAISADYTKLYTSYDSMKKEISDLQKKIERLNEQNQALNSKNYELKNQNDEIKLRLNELEALSDDALKSKLQEWISEHHGTIVIAEFAKVHKVSDARAEEALTSLVNEGYLEVVQ